MLSDTGYYAFVEKLTTADKHPMTQACGERSHDKICHEGGEKQGQRALWRLW
jgi:hypothetical protein